MERDPWIPIHATPCINAIDATIQIFASQISSLSLSRFAPFPVTIFIFPLPLSLSLFPSLRENVTSRPSSALLSPRSYFILLPNQTVVNFVLRIFQIFLELESNFVSFVQREGKFLLLLLLFIYRSEE